MSTHKVISFVKSFTRMTGYVLLWVAFPVSPEVFQAVAVLLVSEVIGIIEEIGEK